ncbi:MAG: AAA family ATPase, partial [Pseudomonadota bacterium]
MSDLFEGLEDPQPRPSAAVADRKGPAPLAERLRPKALSEVAGQAHLLGPEGPLGAMLGDGRLASIILWGPPGCGKTTIARLLAGATDLAFEQISAIFTGVAELRKVFEAARLRHAQGRGTLLFVDEIHRFNKAQQDAFLPQMESGVITLVGATTENPSFELNAALLSRAQVLRLKALARDDLASILARAEEALGPLPLE